MLFKRREENLDAKSNLDYKAYKDMLNSKSPKMYGINMLTSYKSYFENGLDINTKEDELSLERIYALYKHNVMTLLSRNFIKYRWVTPDELITATKGMIWDWTDDIEEKKCMGSILYHGLYFPIFTLDKGITHNQLKPLQEFEYNNKYNCYDGNHRADAIKSLYDLGKFYKKVLILIIPVECQYYCNNAKEYTPINYDKDSKDYMVPRICEANPLPYSIPMFHLTYCEEEMRMTGLERVSNIYKGIDIVNVYDYQVMFRILEEFHNVLEVPFTKYFDRHGKLPESINIDIFNDIGVFGKAIHNKDCVLGSYMGVCFGKDLNRNCKKILCCKNCHKRMKCKNMCLYAKRSIQEQ